MKRTHKARTLKDLQQIAGTFQCHHCHRLFKTERGHLNHTCKEMERHDAMKTPEGKKAWYLYQEWFKVQRRAIPELDVFLKSASYMAFIKFARFTKTVNMPRPERYILMMTKEMKFPPTMWSTNELYSKYLQYLDNRTSPKDRVKTMVECLDRIAGERECDIGDVLPSLKANDIMRYLQLREFTPWMLLRSKQFGIVYKRSTREQKDLLNGLMPGKKWKQTFNDNENTTKWVDTIAKGIGL